MDNARDKAGAAWPRKKIALPGEPQRFEYTYTSSVTERVAFYTFDDPVDYFIERIVRAGHAVGQKAGPCIALATFTDLIRGDALIACTGIALDIDGKVRVNGAAGVAQPVDPSAVLARLPFRGVAHTSHGHSPENPKFRVLFPLRTPVRPGSEFRRLWSFVNHRAGGINDPACKNPDHLYFLPRCPAEMKSHAWIKELSGPLLSLDDVPADFTTGTAESDSELGQERQPRRSEWPKDPPEVVELVLTAMKIHPVVEWLGCHPEVPYELWRGIATNVAASVRDGTKDQLREALLLFRKASSGRVHGKSGEPYSRVEIDRCLTRAVEAIRDGRSGPVTYSTLVSYGLPLELAAAAPSSAPVVDCRRWAMACAGRSGESSASKGGRDER